MVESDVLPGVAVIMLANTEIMVACVSEAEQVDVTVVCQSGTFLCIPCL